MAPNGTAIAAPPIWNERLRLAALPRDVMVKLALVAVMIGLAFVSFHLQGNTTDIRRYGRSALLWTVHRWNDSGGDFSHGWLIPFVSIGIIWYRRREIAGARKSVSQAGLYVVILALLMHWLGAKSQQTRLSLAGLILLLWGVPFYFYGWEVARILLFPCAYLVFAMPLNFIDNLSAPLRIAATVVSTALLNGLGLQVRRVGSGIISQAANGFSFDVAPECSGLRSLMAMTALAAVYAYFTQRSVVKQWLLFLSAIPIAFVGNVVRITLVALVAEAFGKQLALGLWHDYSGYVIFSVGIGLMVAAGALLNVDYRWAWQRWKQKLLSPTS